MSLFDQLLQNWMNNGGRNPFEPREEAQPPQYRRVKPSLTPGRKIALLVVAVLAVCLFGLMAGSEFLVDWWWFSSEGFSQVFWSKILYQFGLVSLSAVLSFGVIGFAVTRTYKAAPLESDAQGLTLQIGRKAYWLVAAALLAVVSSLAMSEHWMEALQFIHGSAFGASDPLFGKDVGFYIFQLPFLRVLRLWLLRTLFIALALCCGLVFLTLRQIVREKDIPPSPSRRLLRAPILLFALLALTWGLNYLLARYELLYSPRGVGWGASYTDVHVLIPAYWALAALSLVVAAGAFWALVRRPKVKQLAAIAIALLVVAVGLQSFAPGLVQKFIVDPNEFQKEEPYIRDNISSTLKAFGLDSIQFIESEPVSMIRPVDVEMDQDTLQNVRLWDLKALLRSYKQLQEIRTYYTFSGVDTDRYTINGTRRQVMLALRELDPSGLQNPTWVNRHLEFTHGYGLVMNGAGELGANGQPNLWIRDLPPASSVDLDVQQPKVYFGESDNNYVFVKTKVNEFDYPSGNSNARSQFEGDGGASIDSLWRRLVYSIALKDSKILFSDVFTDESRVLMHRHIRTRLQKVAPFLTFDSDPYPVVADGKLLWIVDAYTTSTRYPYSQPMPLVTREDKATWVQPVNYIRNSVKAVVDAHSGHMTFYLAQEKEPMAATLRAIFPGLFTPMSQMSDDLKSHLRYPEDLFRVQARAFRSYHMVDPNTFYNKEDTWETISMENNAIIGGSWGDEPLDMDTYYVTLKLESHEEDAEFMLMTPYTPTGRDNMIAWMAARCEGENYGQLVMKQFSKRTLIYGPNQVSALINQTPEISAQLSLWTQRGSDVLLGHLLVVPVGDALLYVQPLYLKAERSDLPELKRVIVSSGGQVAWGETFDEALQKLMGAPLSASTGGEAEQSRALQPQSADDAALLQAVRKAFDEGKEALSRGDWADWSRQMEELERLLEGH